MPSSDIRVTIDLTAWVCSRSLALFRLAVARTPRPSTTTPNTTTAVAWRLWKVARRHLPATTTLRRTRTTAAVRLTTPWVCGGDCAADADGDGVCDDEDDCVGTYDECGVQRPWIGLRMRSDPLPEGDCDCNGNQLDECGACGGAVVFEVTGGHPFGRLRLQRQRA